jgi:hypothetical protein
MVDAPLGTVDQLKVERLQAERGAAIPAQAVRVVGDAIKDQVADGLAESLKEVEVHAINTDEINTKK